MHSIGYANQCLDLMDCRMVGKNEATYSELLKLAVWQKNLFAVHEIWKEYILKYILNILPLRRFIWFFARLGDLKSVYEVLQKMIVLAIRGSTLYEHAGGMWSSSRLDIPIPSKHVIGLKQFDSSKLDGDASGEDQGNIFSFRAREPENVWIRTLNVYKSPPVRKLLTGSFNDVIHACAYSNNYWLVEKLLAQMPKLGPQLTSHTYDAVVKAVISERGFRRGMEVDQPECAVRVLAKMRKIELPPDIKTYEVLFSLFGNVNAPYEKGNKLSQVNVARRIKVIELDMAKKGVQHSHLSMKNLLKALGAEEMKTEMIHYLHVAESLYTRNQTYLGTPIYSLVLHSLVEAKLVLLKFGTDLSLSFLFPKSHMAIEMFKSMRSCGLLSNCEHAECSRCQIRLKMGNFNEALDLLEQASSEGIQFDVLLFNTILWRASDKVLSMRMLCNECGCRLPEETEPWEDFVLAEDEEAESRMLQLFENFEEGRAVALLSLRWSAMLGYSIFSSPDHSPCAKRLSTKYGTKE